MLTPPPTTNPAHDADILARTIWGEARGELLIGKYAIACVILNRLTVAVKRPGFWGWQRSVAEICLQPWQFSCWNKKDPNARFIHTINDSDAAFASCEQVARRVLEIGTDDVTNGATHYHTANVTAGWDKVSRITAHIGQHIFYRPLDVPG